MIASNNLAGRKLLPTVPESDVKWIEGEILVKLLITYWVQFDFALFMLSG